MNNSSDPSPINIVFFDDSCAICNRFFLFLEKYDRREELHFSSLKGKTFQQLAAKPFDAFDSIAFQKGESIYFRSEAFIQLAIVLFPSTKSFLNRLSAFSIPLDYIYDRIAKIRHRLIQTRECPIPMPQTRARILP